MSQRTLHLLALAAAITWLLIAAGVLGQLLLEKGPLT